MTVRHEIETLSFAFFASMILTIGIVMLHKSPVPIVPTFHADIPFTQDVPTITPLPTPAPIPQITTTSQLSSDGKEKLTLKVSDVAGNKTYTLTLTDTTTSKDTTVLSRQIGTDSAMLVPFNTFSPDNTYFFITRKGADGTHYLVFQTSGNQFASGQYIDVTPLFTNYTNNYTISDVTGWGDNTLLIINAKSTAGQNASFWFNVSNEGFIPLSNYFP